LFEAVRFDPLAPGLLRVATADTSIAAGTAREQVIPAGKKVLAAFASAMRDARRVADPERFDITRPECDYFHFGYGLHRCFGEAINRQVLPVILQALLCQPITRAPGAAGHLTKRLFFADRLAVTWR
jgi:cytochrome P450